MTRDETIKSATMKVILSLLRKAEKEGFDATFPWLREQTMKMLDDSICYFHNVFDQMLKDEEIFKVNGFYCAKRPTKWRSVDDPWVS